MMSVIVRNFFFVIALSLGMIKMGHALPSDFEVSGKKIPRIIINTNAAKSEHYAAEELAEYIEKITGFKLPVVQSNDSQPILPDKPVIIIGYHPDNLDLIQGGVKEEESIIEVTPYRIRIIGGRQSSPPLSGTFQDRGTLYGVYNLLDQLGVRWYRPEPWGEFVPQSVNLKIPVGTHRSNPHYAYRMGFLGSYRWWSEATPQQNAQLKIWSARNRENTLTGATAKLGGARVIQVRHVYKRLFPAEQYFSEHPEYYALIDGVRRKDGQICVGNPEVQQLAAKKILEFAEENPQYEMLSLEPDDHSRWCQCDLCTRLDDPSQKNTFGKINLDGYEISMGDVCMSNRVNKFGAIVSQIVAEKNSTLKLIWLAYADHTQPPSQVQKLPENTMIMPAAFTSSFSDPKQMYTDYSRNLFDPDSKPNQKFVEVLEGYGKLSPLLIREYWSGIAWFGPMPLIRTMQNRLQSYKKFRVEGIYSETHPHWGPQGITLYFYTRLLWNPDLDVEKELELYCKNYYGPAYEPMLAYHRLLENAASSGISHYAYGIQTHQIFTPDVMQKLGAYMSEAKLLIGAQQPYVKRFEGVWAGYEYARLVLPYHEELEKGNLLEAAMHWERANKFILSYKEGDVFDNGVMFGSLQKFGNYRMSIPENIRNRAKALIEDETKEY